MQQLDRKHTLRVGSLVFHSLGQLLPHQMQAFHSENAIHPVSSNSVLAPGHPNRIRGWILFIVSQHLPDQLTPSLRE